MTSPLHHEDEILADNLQAVHRRTDHLFFWLLIIEWAVAIVLASFGAPEAAGLPVALQPAVVGGGFLTIVPLLLIWFRPGWWGTRYTVAVSQMLWSGLLIQVTGGRAETHFHVFGSLAFLAFYRDWRTLLMATATVAGDQLVRGVVWPASVYATAHPEWWRFLEHAAWIAFEDGVLIFGSVRSIREMRVIARREAALELSAEDIEREVNSRTAELAAANASLQSEMNARLQVETDLRQAQKLESVGRLAAGVAHEINTPVQFVSDSVHFLRDATTDLMTTIAHLREVEASVLAGTPSLEAAEAAAYAAETADLPYLIEHMPKAIDRALDGLERVATIVRSMKEFAHPDAIEMAPVDLNRAIESTLVIARNEYKYVADVVTDFAVLPPVCCHAGDVNQAVLNIVVNAAHAIADVVAGTPARGRITVRTALEGEDTVVVTIADTGGGIPLMIRDRVFDPFFTTKEVGRGTGQGLAIARAIIVDRHRGELTLDSEVGRGTTCFMRLPLHGATPTLSTSLGAAA
ncbi:MAG: ATP-binding protein [Vicinamibacteraceae bacterium]